MSKSCGDPWILSDQRRPDTVVDVGLDRGAAEPAFAEFKNGVLIITIGKKAESQSSVKRIPVEG